MIPNRSLVCRGLLALAVLLPAAGALAAIPRYNDIMPISQVRPGMKGYGLTVFRGTTIEKFDVTVVGVVKKGSLVVPGHDMILVHMAGGPMTTRQANLIRGMSGSPVYMNGKMIGAFSQGEPTTKEPLGGVTPIEDMLEAWDPKLPDKPTAFLPDNRVRTAILSQPIHVGDRTIRKVVYNVPLTSHLRSQGSTLVMHPCTTFATFASASRVAREKLAKALAPYNVELAQNVTGNAKPGFKGSPLVPGAAFSMMLATGDLTAGATGTVSYRKGDRILGFGHPFMGIGPIDAPLCSAYIYDVYPLLSGSYKISSPGPIVGSSTQDRNFAISGVVGRKPNTIPVTVDVRDLTTGRARVFHSQAVAHPLLYAALVSSIVSAAVEEIRNVPGAAMARITTTVDAEELGKITRSNVVFDSRGIEGSSTNDLDDLLGILTSNPFYPLGIKSADVKVEIETAHRTAQVERIFLKEGRFEPGQTAEVGVVIKPYKQPSVTKMLKIAIPQNTPTGRYMLTVRGGAVPAGITIGNIVLRPSAPTSPEVAPPVNTRQMVNRYNEREKNNDLVARLQLPSTAVNVEGEKLSNLPPSLDAIMRSSKSSGVRLERDEVKVVEPTDWVIGGQQALMINVQRKDIQETPTATPPSGLPAGGIQPGVISGGVTTFESDLSTDIGDEGDSSNAPEAPRDDARMMAPAGTLAPASPASSGQKPATGAKGAAAPATPGAATTAAPGAATTATAAAATPDKPVARTPQVWRQTTRADFAKGTAHGLSVSTLGDLRLTRTLKRIHTSTESFIWCLIPDGQGGLYAGTGTQAQVLHVDANGSTRVFTDLPELAVHSLLRTADGTLWAATSPNGRVYRITPDGKSTMAFQTKEKYALALASDSQGNVYVGTGGGAGNIYRITPDGKGGIFCKTSEEHVLSLAADKAGNLYAGTGGAGIVYRVSPQGQPIVIYDAPEQSIAAIAVNSKGDVYAATAPKGMLYRISPDGTAKTVYDKAPSAFTALAIAPDDTVYVGGGSAVYTVKPDNTVDPLDNDSDVDILALAVAPGGTLYAGTGNVAEIYAAAPVGQKQAGSYESLVHDAKMVSRWGSIRWSATAPAGTRLAVQTRTGNVAEPDSTWSAWAAPRPEPEGGRITSPAARYIQYRVVVESDTPAVSPALREVSVTYLPKNQAPKITFQAPTGGERWANKQTIKWQADDPDKDTLNYDLMYSPDNGAHWTPVPAAAAATPATTTPVPVPATGSKAPTPVIVTTAQPGRAAPPSVEEVTSRLDTAYPNLPPNIRESILAQARKANADYQAAQGSTTGAPSAPAAASASASRETTRTVDTHALPDGRYMLKVVASDRPSNPVDPQTGEALSEPFVICNAPPSLFVFQAMTKVNPDRTVSLEGLALQKMISITAVQYRVDSGEWIAAVPRDGIFDTPSEAFSIQTTPLAAGSHTIEVKAFNAASNTATDKTTIEVK